MYEGIFRRYNKMSVLEIVSGAIMLAVSILLVILTIMQPPKQQNMSTAISGSSGNFFDKNGGTTREEALAKLTKILAAVLFVVTLAANIISVVSAG